MTFKASLFLSQSLSHEIQSYTTTALSALHYATIHPFMHAPPIWAGRSSQQVHTGPPGCLLAAQCPSPSAGSWPPHCSRWLPRSGSLPCTRSCPSQPAGSDASGGIRRSSRLAATSDSWLVREKKRKLLRAPVSGAATVPSAYRCTAEQNEALPWSG